MILLLILDVDGNNMEMLLHNMSMVVSGDQFDKKKLLDTMLYHLHVGMLKMVLVEVVLVEVVVKHLNFSSFLMILLNSTHRVIMFVVEVHLNVNIDIAVQMVVRESTNGMMRMVYEVHLKFDSVE